MYVSVWVACGETVPMGLAATKGYAGGKATVNGPRERAELTGLAQPLWTRPPSRLHGFMLPITQMDGGRGWKRGGKCQEAMLGGVERGDTRRLAMGRINVKIRQRKSWSEIKKTGMLPWQLQHSLDQWEWSTSSFLQHAVMSDLSFQIKFFFFKFIKFNTFLSQLQCMFKY